MGTPPVRENDGGPDTGPVAIVLPPKEGFTPDAVGAIGLLVHRLAMPGDVVVGRPSPQGVPFAGVAFRPADPGGGTWPRSDAARYAAAVARVLEDVRPRLIEVHNRPEIALRLSRRFPHIPMLLVLHNDPRGMRRAETGWRRRRLARRMRVAAVSDWLRHRFQHGIDRAEPFPDAAPAVALLPNCLDLASLPPPSPPAEREKRILFVGRVVADKGADLFVEACAAVLPRLAGWDAVMLGADRFSPDAPDTPFLRALRPRAEAAGVRMAGHQNHAAVLDAMARAAIVAVPSRWEEPFGLTALEAMASGAALVASTRGGLRELASGAALMVDPDQPGALADALERLASDEALRRRMVQAGFERARRYDVPAARNRLSRLRASLRAFPD
ncbi:glycosyltransferase family 4 protein [Acetobacteraceae bacterium KSS12]|uniref:Glycosyltransferase family 4 protein n=1 Tax=Rhizosaccharibacter radicis TaxID=2782605 RepID=A0ABT1VTC9_9PROT|nr:glycosyltransferase family 4 protein [Acetobacteraceae bacterium KSS12]